MSPRDAPKILLVKLGLDGHDRGLHMLALELRDRGVEIVVLGTGTTPEQAASSAVEEDVDAVGISSLSGSHLALVPRLVDELKAAGDDIAVVCGGVIPKQDAERLQALGVSAVAPVGTSVQHAADLLLSAAHRARR